MPDYVRVTDDVTPRREYSVLATQVSDAHKALKKPAAYADGTPIPPKYLPASLAPKIPASSESDKSGGQTSPQEKE